MNPPQYGHHPPPMFPGRGMGEETPISKYLANLEKRKSIFHPRSSPPKISTGAGGVALRLNFNDDTFFGGNPDESILQSSPAPSQRLLPSTGSVFKRKRTSFFAFDNDDEDPEVLRNKNGDLERLLRQTQAELIDARTSCTKLDQAHIETKKLYTEKLIAIENCEVEAKIKCKNADEKVAIFEKQLEQSRKKEAEMSDNLKQQRDAYSTKFAAVEGKMSELHKQNFELKQNLSKESIKAEEALRKLQREYNETEHGAEKWIMDSQIYQDQLNLVQSQLQKCQADLKIAQVDAIKYQEANMRYNNNVNLDIVREKAEIQALEERCRKYENLFVKEQSGNQQVIKLLEKTQAENTILRSTIRAEMILHEQITSLESQLQFLRAELVDKGKAEAERNMAQSELNSLKDIISKLDYNCTTPLAFEGSLRQTQNLLLELKHDNSNLKLSLESVSRNANNLHREVTLLRDQVKCLKDDKFKSSLDLKKLSRRMGLIVKDRDGLKDLKESYEKEFEGMISEPLKARISTLEEAIGAYEALLNEEPKKSCADCEQKMLMLENLKTELETTQREKDTLSQTLSSANEDTGFKIVSFGNNPSMLSIEDRLKECLKENEELKEKLRGFEDDTMVALGNESILEEKEKLQEDLRALERKHEILTEAYDYETVQLQQACTKLFGYYVTLVREPQSQIRLQSVYSNCSDDVFIFQEAENTDMMLLETPILEHFRDDIDKFLMREGSIPSFLASVTITYAQDQDNCGQLSQPSQSQSSVPTEMSITNIEGNQSHEPEPVTVSDQVRLELNRNVAVENESDDEDDEEQEEEEEDDETDHEDEDPVDDDDGDDDEDDSGDQDDVIMID